MPVTVQFAGGNTTLTITRIMTNAKAAAFFSAFAASLYDENAGYYPKENGVKILPASLTNQQKAQLLEDWMIAESRRRARAYHVNQQVRAATQGAYATVDGELDL